MNAESTGDRVAIIGLGVIGGSVARALRLLRQPPEITAWSASAPDLERALADEVIQAAETSPREALNHADVIVYGTPVGATLEFMDEHHAAWPESAIIMDLGSVKREIMDRARTLGLGDRFVGAHPMAGSERSGYEASRQDMFDGARVWICAAGGPSAEARAFSFWRAVGGEPSRIQPREHDRLMARASHLPQIVATALGLALEAASVDTKDLGPGAGDMTRLAASSPHLWTDLLLRNADVLAEPLAAMGDSLEGMRRALISGDADRLTKLLERARRWRGERV